MRQKILFSMLILFLALSLSAQTVTHKALVILVNFQNRVTEPVTVEQVRAVDDSVSAYYREQSFNQFDFTFDVTGWHTLPMDFVICDKALIASLADTAAANAGYDLSQYQHRIYEFPGNGCGWAGSANVIGPRVWMNTFYDMNGVAHELGHNLGLLHSNGLRCGDVPLSDTGCTILEYGDYFCVMGANASAHFNAFQKERMQWTTPQSVNASGIYHIDAYEPAGGVKSLKIQKDWNGNFYYIEQRTAYGFDSIFTTNFSNALDGVLVHIGNPTKLTVVIVNMHPILDPNLFTAALEVGETFSAGNVSFRTLSVDPTGADVQIDMTPLPPPPPPTPTPVPSPTPIPPLPPVCLNMNPRGKCTKWLNFDPHPPKGATKLALEASSGILTIECQRPQ